MSAASTHSSMQWPGLDAMHRLFDHCRLETVALREGGLRGVLGSRVRAGASLCSFVFDFPCHGRFLVPAGHYLFCHVHQASMGSWCAGMPLRSGTALIVLPGSACEVMINAHSSVSVLLAPLHDGVVRAIERNVASADLASRKFSMFGPECHAASAWQFRCESAFHALVDTRRCVDSAIDRLFDALLDPSLLDDWITHPYVPPSYSSDYYVHYRSFRRAVEFMRANLHRDIYLDELSRAAGMSDRTLRYAFADLLSVSPTRYLALLRLHEASRQLSAHGVGRISVKSVAMNCGWWDLSRFAANYRRAFGEHPRDTLMRACSVAS